MELNVLYIVKETLHVFDTPLAVYVAVVERDALYEVSVILFTCVHEVAVRFLLAPFVYVTFTVAVGVIFAVPELTTVPLPETAEILDGLFCQYAVSEQVLEYALVAVTVEVEPLDILDCVDADWLAVTDSDFEPVSSVVEVSVQFADFDAVEVQLLLYVYVIVPLTVLLPVPRVMRLDVELPVPLIAQLDDFMGLHRIT